MQCENQSSERHEVKRDPIWVRSPLKKILVLRKWIYLDIKKGSMESEPFFKF